MQNQCTFLTEKERLIVEFLKDSPKLYSEIVKKLIREEKIKDRRTANELLNEMVTKKLIFRIEIDGKVFYKLNVFPQKILAFFNLAEQIGTPELLEIKDEVIRCYPTIPFEKILYKWRKYLELTNKPQYTGLIHILKEFEGNKLTFF